MLASQTSFPAFGRRLKHARRAQGIKQAALAERLNVDQTTVSRWENGTQMPDVPTQWAAFDILGPQAWADDALLRLVSNSTQCVHLVHEASHVCLAYSKARARDWRVNQGELLGVSLWQFATDDIRHEESLLEGCGWWDQHTPSPRRFTTAHLNHDKIYISAGEILWERLYLADGTAVRLVSGSR